MTNRESWEEVKFQVFTDEAGVLRSGFYPTGAGLVDGNVAVDFAWGNIPMQPNDDRTDTGYSFGGGEGDAGWSATYTYSSDTLRTSDYDVTVNNAGLVYTTPADSHTIATTGYSNYPGFIPNYAGDGDAGAEVAVPDVVGKTATQANALLSGANLVANYNTVIPVVEYGVTSTTTVTLTVDSSYNLKKGDSVYVDSVVVGETPYGVGNQVLTAVTSTSISFANTAEWSFDDVATGEVWAINPKVISQDPVAGDIVDEESTVDLTILYVD